MTAEELREAYPGAADVVVANEFGVDPESGAWMKQVWDHIRLSGMCSMEVVVTLKECAEKAVTAQPVGPLTGRLDQFDHPDFLRYVAAKLGAMAVMLAALLSSSCTVSGKVYCEHRQGPDVAGASMEFKR